MATRGKVRKKGVTKASKKKSAKKIAKKKAVPRKAAAKTVKAVKVSKTQFIGQPAPPFTLPTGDGQTISLSEFRGKRVLLYFYPKDDTPGCTAQACALRDNIQNLAKDNTVVIGVSKDDVLSHQRFKNKYQLNFLLASDKETGVSEKYGVWVEKNMYGRKYMGIERSTFLIDENGVVRGEWRKVSVPDHLRNVRSALATL